MESLPTAPTAGVRQSPSQFLESLSLWVHPDSRLLICFDEDCRHAISPNGSHPTDHLRDKHKIPLSRRKGLSKVLATLNLKNPEQAAPLVDGSPEDKRLRSYDGFSCLHCEYRTINLTLIVRHYSQDLPEYPQHPRKSTRRADIETYFEYVYLQAWASGSSRAYWIVERYGRPDAPPYLLASAARVPGLSGDLVSPREDEVRIDRILKVVDAVMDRCEETVHSTSRSLLCWLKSNHPHVPYPKPFTLVKHTSSTTRYRLLLKKALAFCFRAYRMDAKQRERLVGVRFNKKLDNFLNAIWHHEDLANPPPTALGAYPIEDVAQAQQQAQEVGEDEMRVEHEDMDVDGSVYEDLGKADDDSEEEDDDSEEEADDGDLYSASDDDDGDDSGNAFRPTQ